MSKSRIIILTLIAMIAFAGNSLLCRLALQQSNIDAASFTFIRLMSGAVMLWIVIRLKGVQYKGASNWWSALGLFVYAAGFSFAYVRLPTAIGALLLFGAVQITMIGYGVWAGERLLGLRLVGVMLALGGLVGLLLPDLSAPPLNVSLLMLVAGAAWGFYSLCGKRSDDPTLITAGNFLRAVPVAGVLCIFMWRSISLDDAGIWYAVSSGALASGIGYAIWYAVLPALNVTNAALLQLCVPLIAALGGFIFLGEAISLHLALSSVAILGGIALVILNKQ